MDLGHCDISSCSMVLGILSIAHKYVDMLLVYLEPFQQAQQQLLASWRLGVTYWPRSWAYTDLYNAAIPTDWWLLFSNYSYADIWMIKYPELSRVIMRDV